MKKILLFCTVVLILLSLNGLAAGLINNTKNSNYRHRKTIKIKKRIINVTFAAINYSPYQDYNLTLTSGGNSYPLYIPAAGSGSSFSEISLPEGTYSLDIVPATWPSFSQHIGHYIIGSQSASAPRGYFFNVNVSDSGDRTLQVSAAN